MFENLFDIGSANVLDISIEEDRKFLIAQREPGRRGTMELLHINFTKKENRKK